MPPETATQTLAGCTVAVTAARRADEQVVMLERRGARVLAAPAIHMIPVAEDSVVRQATERVLDPATEVDCVVITTAAGLRWWDQVAEEWGRAEELHGLLARVPVYSRGPKVTGALRAMGVRERAAAKSETSAELVEMLTAEPLTGRTVVVQTQGAGGSWNPMAALVDGLRDAGADVVEVPLYRWEPVLDDPAWDELVLAAAGGAVDGVTFTSAPAVVAMLDRADALGVLDDLLDALRGPVLPLCVGPVTAAPLAELGIEGPRPERMRLGALLRLAAEVLAERAETIEVGGHTLRLWAAGVVVDGRVVPLAPSLRALLGVLAENPGACIGRAELLAKLPGEGADEHAVETAVGRLRKSLGEPGLVATVVKRGYRLAV